MIDSEVVEAKNKASVLEAFDALFKERAVQMTGLRVPAPPDAIGATGRQSRGPRVMRRRFAEVTMADTPTAIDPRKTIALVAHDNVKKDLLDWARANRAVLSRHHIVATGTTGTLLEDALALPVSRVQSGPLGGDQQIGAKIVEGAVDFVIFFWDPLEAQPHDPDVRALLRIAIVWNIPVACNRASADFMISSPLMEGRYERRLPDYSSYRNRLVP